ncbi:MAG: helix-turn-helix domain-containing protein [Candidatus Aminicenantes bacterium]|nr:helix-turn-helix domain-containing protein [Candidatus Aminicenantes bacterium]
MEKERSFLSVRQAAKVSSLSPRFLYEKCQKRKLRYYKVGKRIVIDREDLTAFLTQEPVEPVNNWAEELRLK